MKKKIKPTVICTKPKYYSFWEELREILKSPEYDKFVENQKKGKNNYEKSI